MAEADAVGIRTATPSAIGAIRWLFRHVQELFPIIAVLIYDKGEIRVVRTFIAGLVVLSLVMLNVATPASAAAASGKVKVAVPQFAVEINGKKMDSARALHPPLTYRDVVYLPLTSNVADALGLQVRKDAKTGLTISSLRSGSPLQEEKKGGNNAGKTYDAQIAKFAISINDKKIDNEAKKYPILLFRDVVYLPLTWQFTHDFFRWETEWNAKTGYKVRSAQSIVLSEIVADDEKYLYVQLYSGGLYKIGKALDGKFSKVGDQENREIWSRVEARNREMAPQTSKLDDVSVQGEFLYFRDQKLVSIKPYLDQNDAHNAENPDDPAAYYLDASQVEWDDANSLLIVRLLYLTHIPGPYTPSVTFTYAVHQGKAVPVAGFTQWPDKLLRNTDGSYWISSSAPARYNLEMGNIDMQAELAFVDKAGNPYNLNERLKAKAIDLLYADDQGALVKAYNDRLDPATAAPTDGFYKLDSGLKATKIADSLPGMAYVGLNKQLFALDPETNRITNVTTGKSFRWWDYELRQDG